MQYDDGISGTAGDVDDVYLGMGDDQKSYTVAEEHTTVSVTVRDIQDFAVTVGDNDDNYTIKEENNISTHPREKTMITSI